jgi:hypothetical protein
VSRDKYPNFLKVLKIKYVLSVHAVIVLKILCCLVMEKIKDKVLACFYENTVKPLPVTLFKLLVAAYRKPSVIL